MADDEQVLAQEIGEPGAAHDEGGAGSPEVLEGGTPAVEIPDKFRDKSLEEVIAAYSNLERAHGTLANEHGRLKRVVEERQAPVEPAHAAEPAKTPEQEREERCRPDAEAYFEEMREQKREVYEAKGFTPEEIEEHLARDVPMLGQKAWQRAFRDDARIEGRIGRVREQVAQAVVPRVIDETVSSVMADEQLRGLDRGEVSAVLQQMVPAETFYTLTPAQRMANARTAAVFVAGKMFLEGRAPSAAPSRATEEPAPFTLRQTAGNSQAVSSDDARLIAGYKQRFPGLPDESYANMLKRAKGGS